MSLKITSVTYRRYHGRAILDIGRFSRVKPPKTAGGLRETLCPEMAFASAGGRLFARSTSTPHVRFRRHFPVAGGRHFEYQDPAPGPNAGKELEVFLQRYIAMHQAMHPRPAKSRR
jgi:hypothetical protein